MDKQKLDEIRQRAEAAEILINDLHTERLDYSEYLTLIETPHDVDTLLTEVDRLTRERDAAIRDLNGGQACFSCKHFRRNSGECFGAGICRVDGVKIFPCDEPYMYRVEIPNNGRDVYEWRGLTRNDEKEEK
jgi:hypothetical protein